MEELTKKTQLKATRKVLHEMNESQKIISDWNASWRETCHNAYNEVLGKYLSNDVKALQKQYKDTYDLDDIIHNVPRVGEPLKKETLTYENADTIDKYECEFGEIHWDLNTNKNRHSFIFDNKGNISYSKNCKKYPNQNHPINTKYDAKYNVLSNNFDLDVLYDLYAEKYTLPEKYTHAVNISLNDNILKLTYNTVEIFFNLRTGKKVIKFNTYENKNRKVNGIYRFETYDGINIDAAFYSRKGNKIDLASNCEVLEKAIKVLFALLNKKDFDPAYSNISDIFDQTEEYLINLFSSLENTIPLVGMSERLNNCSNSIKQLNGIVRNLQK